MWGAYHGALLGLERWNGKGSFYAFLPVPARKGATFVLVLISWVLFRASNLGQAGDYLGCMFGFHAQQASTALLSAQILTPANVLIFAVAGVFAFSPAEAEPWTRRLSWPKVMALLGLFLGSLMVMSGQAFNPFLYFQF